MCWIEEHPAPALGKNHTRPPSKNLTTEQQMKLNDRYAALNLSRKIAGNFVPGKDLFCTLDHQPWVSEKNAKKARRKFLGLMRDWFRDQGKEFKYVIVTEKQGSWHHHLVMEGVKLETIREFWKKATEGLRTCEENRVMISPLSDFDNYKSLAEYFVNPEKPSRKADPTPAEAENAKAPRRKGARRYSSSKNLEKLAVTPQVIKRISKSEPKPPKGYKLQTWNKWCDNWGDLHAEYTCIWAGGGRPTKARRRNYINERRYKSDEGKNANTNKPSG